MDYAERLNRIIDNAGKRFDSSGYTPFEDPAKLEALKKANVFFTTSVLGMKAISYVIENQAMTLKNPFRLYSGFQRFSRIRPQQNRYLKILTTKNPVYIFGLPDKPLWEDPNLIPIALEEPILQNRPYLAHNWFVVLHNPELVSMALVSREVPNQMRPAGASNKLIYRSFEGFWTYDKEVVSQVVEVFEGYIKQKLGKH
jgi:DICT domain-containing protein